MERIIDCLRYPDGFATPLLHLNRYGKSNAENGHMFINSNDIALFEIASSH